MNYMTDEERKKYKGMGFVPNRDGKNTSVRIVTKNGVLSSEQMRAVCEIADTYGNGKVTITSRMGLELPVISYDNIQNVIDALEKADLAPGGTGAKVRPVTACKGTVCPHGNFDTQEMALEIHYKFYEGYRSVKLPHKFKIGVGGCPNNCIKPDINDIGVVGVNVPKFELDKCVGCAECVVESKCPVKTFKKQAGPDPTVCTKCGKCVETCPFGVVPSGQKGFKMYLGGRWGKAVRRGDLMKHIVTSKEELFELIEKVILLYKAEGIAGERFGNTIDRIGMEKAEKILQGNGLLEKKNEIINA